MTSICPVFKWSGCPVFKWHSNTGPFGIQPLLNHLKSPLNNLVVPAKTRLPFNLLYIETCKKHFNWVFHFTLIKIFTIFWAHLTLNYFQSVEGWVYSILENGLNPHNQFFFNFVQVIFTKLCRWCRWKRFRGGLHQLRSNRKKWAEHKSQNFCCYLTNTLA